MMGHAGWVSGDSRSLMLDAIGPGPAQSRDMRRCGIRKADGDLGRAEQADVTKQAGLAEQTELVKQAGPSGQNLHASCIAFQGRALLILGPSGSGKSTLALALMGLGCDLVADDRTDLRREGDDLIADAPATLSGLIEARGLGILAARAIGPSKVTLCIDLAPAETHRLPLWQERAFLGISLPLVLGPLRPHLEYGLKQYLAMGRSL